MRLLSFRLVKLDEFGDPVKTLAKCSDIKAATRRHQQLVEQEGWSADALAILDHEGNNIEIGVTK